jgi:formylglycine-generating enzyme required for sulfatase activity
MEGLPPAYDHSTWECNGGDPYEAVGYRLPTDAEWEYAAQYDDERVNPWGNEEPDCSRANCRVSGYDCVGWTAPVGSYPGGPDILGEVLYDMAGNVWEWCNDRVIADLGTVAETNPLGASSGEYRVIHGGCWFSDTVPCAERFLFKSKKGDRALGFRCVKSH